jgi:hypothetical protein
MGRPKIKTICSQHDSKGYCSGCEHNQPHHICHSYKWEKRQHCPRDFTRDASFNVVYCMPLPPKAGSNKGWVVKHNIIKSVHHSEIESNESCRYKDKTYNYCKVTRGGCSEANCRWKC